MQNLIAAANTWVMLAVVGGLMILMMVVSIIPQKKRQKQAQAMMSKITKGDKIKTIGGFVGTVSAIDDATNTIILNLGSEEAPIVVTVDKAAVYTVINSNAPQVVETPEGEKVAVEEEVKSIDDAEEDAKKAEENAAKAKKAEEKAKSKAAKLAKEPVEVAAEEVFEEVKAEEVKSDDEITK